MDKTLVLQEAQQCFVGHSIKTKRLIEVLTKCLFILLQGERLTPTEATQLFFHMTRLLQYKDKDRTLRRLTYIGIRALCSHQAENVYVVAPSLAGDVQLARDDAPIRASALRALCEISIDHAANQNQNYLKQALLDKHPAVTSAAISALLNIVQVNRELVLRCSDEIKEALYSSESPMVQYHALGLLYELHKEDKLTVSRLISDSMQQEFKTPLFTCLLIRIITSFIAQSSGGEFARPIKNYIDYIEQQLKHQSEMVEYEAAEAIVNLTPPLPAESKARRAAMSHLRNFLTSSKSALRFASVRLLNQLTTSSSSSDSRFWSVHRIGSVCKLHLLNKRYRIGDHIIGVIDFANSNTTCAKYAVMLQCEEAQQYELKQEFSLGLEKSDFMLTIPNLVGDNNNNNQTTAAPPILHCVLSFLFYIVDKNYPKTLFEDKAGTIELGPSELDTKLFSCDFPIVICT